MRMDWRWRKLAMAACLLTACSSVLAGNQNDIPSCYAANKITNRGVVPDREIFVLIDQTTVLDSNLQQAVRDNVAPFARSGSAFVVAQFSAFSQGRYMNILNAGRIESPIAQNVRSSVSERLLRTFDACMQGQRAYAARVMAQALNSAMRNSSDALANSDVISSLKEMSARVRISVAKEKVVFVVSDMLENSSLTSFYSHGGARNIDPMRELKIAEKNDEFGDFGGANVYVLGAGLVPETKGAKTYRDPRTMNSLKEFWRNYFQRSNATLVEFGMPVLMSPLQ